MTICDQHNMGTCLTVSNLTVTFSMLMYLLYMHIDLIYIVFSGATDFSVKKDLCLELLMGQFYTNATQSISWDNFKPIQPRLYSWTKFIQLFLV